MNPLLQLVLSLSLGGSLLALLPAAVYLLSWRIAIRLYEKRNL